MWHTIMCNIKFFSYVITGFFSFMIKLVAKKKKLLVMIVETVKGTFL